MLNVSTARDWAELTKASALLSACLLALSCLFLRAKLIEQIKGKRIVESTEFAAFDFSTLEKAHRSIFPDARITRFYRVLAVMALVLLMIAASSSLIDTTLKHL